MERDSQDNGPVTRGIGVVISKPTYQDVNKAACVALLHILNNPTLIGKIKYSMLEGLIEVEVYHGS